MIAATSCIKHVNPQHARLPVPFLITSLSNPSPWVFSSLRRALLPSPSSLAWWSKTRCDGGRKRTYDSCTSGSSAAAWVLRSHLVSILSSLARFNFQCPSTSVCRICVFFFRPLLREIVFGDGYLDKDGEFSIDPRIVGFMSSCYQLGSILAVPVAPWLSQRYGRRMSVFVGSVIMVIGAILQGFAQHSEFQSTSIVRFIAYTS
jgi:hypothetical protein